MTLKIIDSACTSSFQLTFKINQAITLVLVLLRFEIMATCRLVFT